MDILSQLGNNFMGNVESIPTNLRTNLGNLVGGSDINNIIGAGGKTPGGFNATTGKMGTPGSNDMRMKMAMLLGGLGGGPIGMGMGAGGGGQNIQQLLPLLMLLSQMQGKMP